MTGSKTTLLILVSFILCIATMTRSEFIDLSPELASAPAPGPAGAKGSQVSIPQPLKKYFVRIINSVAPHTLHFVCRSEDDTIERTLPSGQSFEFGFKVNIPFTTLFACDLTYLNHRAHFDAFKTDIDFLSHCTGVHCIWKAQNDGIYLMDSDHVYRKRLGWDGKSE